MRKGCRCPDYFGPFGSQEASRVQISNNPFPINRMWRLISQATILRWDNPKDHLDLTLAGMALLRKVYRETQAPG